MNDSVSKMLKILFYNGRMESNSFFLMQRLSLNFLHLDQGGINPQVRHGGKKTKKFIGRVTIDYGAIIIMGSQKRFEDS